MKENDCIDPGDIFMHGSMNISTGIMFGQVHNFNDPEFEYLSSLIKVNETNSHFQIIFK